TIVALARTKSRRLTLTTGTRACPSSRRSMKGDAWSVRKPTRGSQSSTGPCNHEPTPSLRDQILRYLCSGGGSGAGVPGESGDPDLPGLGGQQGRELQPVAAVVRVTHRDARGCAEAFLRRR